jgi:hypothetical protein
MDRGPTATSAEGIGRTGLLCGVVEWYSAATPMIVTAWHDGGGVYGLRVLAGDVSLYFRPEWQEVSILLPGERAPVTVPLTDSFWSTAPELRSPRLRAFLKRHDLLGWERQRPPHFELEPLGDGAFRLRWLERIGGQPTLPLGE